MLRKKVQWVKPIWHGHEENTNQAIINIISRIPPYSIVLKAGVIVCGKRFNIFHSV